MIKDNIIAAFLNLNEKNKLVSGGREIACICPICGGSKTDNKPSFYLGVPEGDDSKWFYQCKRAKCAQQGILTAGFLTKYTDIHDKDLLDTLSKQNFKNRGFVKTIKMSESHNKLNLKILTKYRECDKVKLQYLTDRTGVDFFKADNIIKYKIVINLIDFLKYNNLELKSKSDRESEFQLEMSDYFIGFLSFNNSQIKFRNCYMDKKFYTNKYAYKIDPTNTQPYIYVPSRPIDVMSERPEIVLSENPINIIVVSNKYYADDNVDVLFVGTGSAASFTSALGIAQNITMFYGAKISIYSDYDVKPEHYMYKYFRGQSLGSIKLFYNKNNDSSDFGDIRDKFDVSSKTIQIK